MTQAPYQQAPYQQGYQPQAPAQGQAPYQPQAYQPAPQGQAPYQPQAYQPAPQGPAPYQQTPQQGQYQPQASQQPQNGYQPVAQPGPVQGHAAGQQAAQLPEQHDPDTGDDPMIADAQVFRTGGVAPFMTWTDPQCTGYERGGTILAVGRDTAKVFGTQEPAFWTWGPKKGQQIICINLIVQTQERIPGKVDDTGIRTIELKDGSTRFQAAALAIRQSSPSDLNFRPGAQIYFTRTGERQNKQGTKSTLYNCRYIPVPAGYVADSSLMNQNMTDQNQQLPQAQAPSQGAQNLQQAAAYVATTPNAPVNGGQPQYQPAPPNGQGYAPTQSQGQQQAPWMTQGPSPQQSAPQGQQPAPWMAQGPSQPTQQAPAPWMTQGPQQPAPQGAPQGYTPNPSHPFGPQANQYPPQQ